MWRDDSGGVCEGKEFWWGGGSPGAEFRDFHFVAVEGLAGEGKWCGDVAGGGHFEVGLASVGAVELIADDGETGFL